MEQLLGFPPKEIHYYEEAFTLGTVRTDSAQPHISYERLEFLGDAILGAVIAHFVFLQAPDKNEGDLTKMRTRMVRRENLNQIGEDLRLREYLLADKRTLLSGNIAGNLLEALVGAIYLDRGYSKATEFIHRILIDTNLSMRDLENKVISYKSLMGRMGSKVSQTIAFVSEEDPTYKGRTKYFQAKVMINDKVFAKAHVPPRKRLKNALPSVLSSVLEIRKKAVRRITKGKNNSYASDTTYSPKREPRRAPHPASR